MSGLIYILNKNLVWTGRTKEATQPLVLDRGAGEYYVLDAPRELGESERARYNQESKSWSYFTQPEKPKYYYAKTASLNNDHDNPLYGIVVAASDTPFPDAIATQQNVSVGDKWNGGNLFEIGYDFEANRTEIESVYQTILDVKFEEMVEFLAGNPPPRKEQVHGQEVKWSRSILANDDEAEINKDHILETRTPEELTADIPPQILAAKVLIYHHTFNHIAALATGERRRIEKGIEGANTYLEMIIIISQELATEQQTIMGLVQKAGTFTAKWTSFYMDKAQTLIAAQ